MTKPHLILAGVLSVVLSLMGCHVKQDDQPIPPEVAPIPPHETGWHMPDEAARHRRTWMAFGARKDIWCDLLPDVQANLGLLAKTIAEYEPVTVLVRPEDRKLAARLCGGRVELLEVALDDCWVRDSGPVFVVSRDGELGAVDLNFNGWGNKQAHKNDAAVARFVAEHARAKHIRADLVGEGGGVESDGFGTAILTESCFLNDNRNPGLSKADCETRLSRLFGFKSVVWLPGVRGQDITDGHTDFYARFVGRGRVVAGLETDESQFDYKVTRRHLEMLKAATDSSSRPLTVETVAGPRRIRRKLETKEFAAGYINFYVVNGAVIASEFGDKQADAACREVLEKAFPGRKVVQLNLDAIAAGGGGIHCVTLHEPEAGRE
jgi:agmatine deiminase